MILGKPHHTGPGHHTREGLRYNFRDKFPLKSLVCIGVDCTTPPSVPPCARPLRPSVSRKFLNHVRGSEMVEKGRDFEKKDAGTIEYVLDLEAGGEETFEVEYVRHDLW